MSRMKIRKRTWALGLMTVLLFFWGASGHAAIQGITGPNFELEAKADYIVTSDGDSFLMWGYSNGAGTMQYPGPTLIVNQGDDVKVKLINKLPAEAGNTSIVFPGHKVTAAGGVQGLLTREAPPDGTTVVVYRFTASEPGTYLYRSGTTADLQVEMGLVGALIVYPTGAGFGDGRHAYNHGDSNFRREFLYLMTEMDPVIHRQVELGQIAQVDMTTWFSTNFFVNGRNFPDLLADNNVPWLPTQPYNALPMTRPNEKVLIRYIGAGRQLHPMHYHGNNFDLIAVDGRMLSSDLSDNGETAGADIAIKGNTINSVPGNALDFVWLWNAEKIGWDVYGHAPGEVTCNDGDADDFDDVTGEYCPDHEVPFPVILPERDTITYGDLYSGTPFLGDTGGELPPGHAGLNDLGAYFFIWHSHREKEITSNDIFPGGALTFVIVAPPGAAIPD